MSVGRSGSSTWATWSASDSSQSIDRVKQLINYLHTHFPGQHFLVILQYDNRTNTFILSYRAITPSAVEDFGNNLLNFVSPVVGTVGQFEANIINSSPDILKPAVLMAANAINAASVVVTLPLVVFGSVASAIDTGIDVATGKATLGDSRSPLPYAPGYIITFKA